MSDFIENNAFFHDITTILRNSRGHAYTTVNTIMTKTYWLIGKRIIEEEQNGKIRADYGDKLIENLSRYLTDLFGKGFSEANLQNMRKFYISFPQFPRQCVGNLSWTNIRTIMRLDNPLERDYYLQESAAQNWSTRMLERNIKTGYYKRLLSTKNASSGNKDITTILPFEKIKDFIKDPYVLEFLDVPENITGKENMLEQSLIDNLQKFLLELGKGFSFVARQQRVSTETDHFYVDLVFYNYILKCFVLIDLKSDKLSHGDIGQMDMYVRMYDQLKRNPDDNPTIGIILCADKSETMVKYSVLNDNTHLFASKYKTVLPSEEELAALFATQNQKLLDSMD